MPYGRFSSSGDQPIFRSPCIFAQITEMTEDTMLKPVARSPGYRA